MRTVSKNRLTNQRLSFAKLVSIQDRNSMASQIHFWPQRTLHSAGRTRCAQCGSSSHAPSMEKAFACTSHCGCGQPTMVYGLAAAAKPKPTVRALWRGNTRSSQLSREDTSSGKIVMKDHVFSTRCTFWSLLPRHSFRESCRAQLSREDVEYHCRKPDPLVKSRSASS
jgi:hypothetical protein